MLDQLSAADFHPRVDQSFRLVPDEGDPIEAVLAEVVEHGGEPAEGHRQPFSLFFRAPTGTTARQGTFGVQHGELEPIELFMVPVGEDAAGSGLIYEAVFG